MIAPRFCDLPLIKLLPNMLKTPLRWLDCDKK